MDTGKARFVVRYYGHLMTAQERRACWHLVGTAKAMHGRSDWTAQTETRNKPSHLRRYRYLSDDPEVLNLTREGWDVFVARTVQSILDEHRAEVRFNYCCRCGGLARTPKARQCRFCRHDWHKEIKNSD
jgi:hypothetical protein